RRRESAAARAREGRTPGVAVRTVGIRAQPVVEVEEHRRALGRGLEQVAKLAEDVRTDALALVLREQEPVPALARVNIEVVEPEIGERFLQLPVAVDRPQQLLLVQLDEHAVCLLLNLLQRRIRRLPVAWPVGIAAA